MGFLVIEPTSPTTLAVPGTAGNIAEGTALPKQGSVLRGSIRMPLERGHTMDDAQHHTDLMGNATDRAQSLREWTVSFANGEVAGRTE